MLSSITKSLHINNKKNTRIIQVAISSTTECHWHLIYFPLTFDGTMYQTQWYKYMRSCRYTNTWAISSDCPHVRFVLYLIKYRCLEITPRGSDDPKGEVCTTTHPAVFAVPLWLHIHFYSVQSLIKERKIRIS